MINLETSQFSVVLGVDELKRQAPPNAIAAALVIGGYPLSDDEAATSFIVLAPSEASVDESLRETLCKMPTVVDALGLRIVLICWRDDTESLVGFPLDDTVPSPALLKAAYRNGYGAKRLKALLAKRAEEGRGD